MIEGQAKVGAQINIGPAAPQAARRRRGTPAWRLVRPAPESRGPSTLS